MIQRIFHPIGQGAFYSERHDSVNIVYDCGNLKNSKLSDKVVTQSFSKNDCIDVLFISHFDFDHISKISTLKNHVKEIKRVVLPLLHENEKILLSNIYKVLNFDFLTLISNPQQYFGFDTRIIYVEPTKSVDIQNGYFKPQNIDEISTKDNKIVIESGTAISLNSLKDWAFIPFNYEYKKRNDALIAELKKEGFDCDKLKFDISYSLNEILKDVKLTEREGGKKIKNIYDRLDGKINQNSMLLYSGPLYDNNLRLYCCVKYFQKRLYHSCKYCMIYDRVGCIYTGDSDFNIVNIKSLYSNCWDNVGTIQIPHHGDIKSFNSEILNDRNYCCPISFGNNNTYGHPSNKVISEILSKRSCPVFVTDRLDSLLIEIIK